MWAPTSTICSELGRKRCQAHTRNRAGVQRGTHLLGDSQVPGKKTCPEDGRGPAKPRDERARVTTNHRDGQSACPRNGAHPDQKVGRESGEGVRAVWVQRKEGKKRKACWGGGMLTCCRCDKVPVREGRGSLTGQEKPCRGQRGCNEITAGRRGLSSRIVKPQEGNASSRLRGGDVPT